MSVYSWLKLVHVLSAIVAVGTNLTYFVWLARARRAGPAERTFVLKGIKSIDAWVANPAYIVLPVTGITMVLVEDLGFGTLWISLGLGLFIFMSAFAGIFFSPALRRQIEVSESSGAGSEEYERVAKRTTIMGALTMIPILAIVYVMVMKPTA
jgi:uncharacterized membrane protein